MTFYNFTNLDGLNYENLAFNQTPGNQGYESALCIIPQLQERAAQLDRIEITLLFLAFLGTAHLGLSVLAYLKRKRQT